MKILSSRRFGIRIPVVATDAVIDAADLDLGARSRKISRDLGGRGVWEIGHGGSWVVDLWVVRGGG